MVFERCRQSSLSNIYEASSEFAVTAWGLNELERLGDVLNSK